MSERVAYEVELSLLGGFEVRGPCGQPLPIHAKKARAVLAYLAFHRGKAQSRERLSALIWGDISAHEQARRSLRQALTTIRRAVPERVLDSARDRVMLHPSVEVDVPRFERGVRNTDPMLLEQALHLYRGELLADFTACAAGFDAWVARERRRLRDIAADAMQRLCELQREAGNTAAAMTTAMRLVATDPVREPAHRQLMELYAEAGRTSEAVRHFHELRVLLANQLGAAPDAQTSDLFARLTSPIHG